MSKSISGLHDPYEDQLAAARYRAERDQARQELDRIKSDRSWHACADAGMLLSEEDRGAIRWVSEHGGLDAVKKEWNLRGNFKRQLEKAQEKVERQQRHIEFVQGKCHERLVRIAALNKTVAEMRPRLMPEGMEWPRYEDGEPVAFHDKGLDVHGHTRSVEGVKFTQGGFIFISDDMGNAWWANDCGPMEDPEIDPSKRVKRPAPKVLDADGAEIRVGDRLYDTDTGCGRTVRAVNDNGTVEFDGHENRGWFGRFLTHRAPVLAADGEPLEVGQTVWDANGDELVIGALEDGGHTVTCRYADVGYSIPVHGTWSPSDLTHQRPVLDADGNRIEPAMDVWWVCEGDERGIHAERLHVDGIDGDGMVECHPYNGGTWVELEPSELYVHKPVLDADGVPIKVGDTVYLLPGEWCGRFPFCGFHGGEELEVFADGEASHVPGGVQCREKEKRFGFRGTCYPQPSQLTHTKPEIDTWQRIEEDAGCTATKYNERRGTIFTTKQQVARDLVRRAKKLAGVDND